MSLGDRIAPRALILAAGVGRRLDTVHEPKVLLRFGGRSLLARHLAILRACGIHDVTVVVGFQAEAIRAELSELAAKGVGLCFNPDFTEGSVVSLHAARALLVCGAPLLLMDGDVIYDRRLMARLLDSQIPNCFLLDRDIETGDEPVKLCIAGGQIVDFRKRPSVAHEWHGESVGLYRFTPETAADLAEQVASYVLGGRREFEYEEPIRDMILTAPPGRFGFEDISGLPWTEIDFPEDVAKAHALMPMLAP